MASMLPLTAILNPSGEAKPAVHAVSSRLPSSSAVNFCPFEDLDETSIREIRRFQIHTFGRIQDSCRRIPYNTGKRDFYEKTGRTCFEVFQYDFKVPGCDTPWTVMWDYKIGLVRTTPFFKCCDYSKTISAKMLNLNPGLRDISHSITGGAIRAQGYWMPFECARAVCATFCYRISGALIPLFGPTFPSECIPPNTQHYGRMIINPAIVLRSTREAGEFRRLYGSMPSPPTPSLSSTSTHSLGGHQQIARSLGYRHSDHQGWRSVTTDSDVDGVSHGHFTRLPPLHTHMPTPALSSAESSYSTSTPHSSPRIWTAVNRSYPQHVPAPGQREWRNDYPTSRHNHLEVDPYRSAVSSSPVSQKQFYHQPLPRPYHKEALRPQPKSQPDASSTSWVPGRSHNALSPGDKRPFDDYEYDAGESANGSSPEAPSPRVFQKTTSQNPLHAQPKQETRRCSWLAQVPHPASTTHGSDTSKSNGNGSLAELSEPDPMSQSSHGNVEPKRPLQERGAPFGACDGKTSSIEISKSTNIRNQHEPASSHVNSPRSFNDKSAKHDSPTCENKRVPSFSGAERVAALTLLHLGVLGPQDIDRVRNQRHTPPRQDDQTSDTDMDAHGQENLDATRTAASIAHSGLESDMDMSESTAHSFSDKRAPTSSEAAVRRGSRDRKRRKGKSI